MLKAVKNEDPEKLDTWIVKGENEEIFTSLIGAIVIGSSTGAGEYGDCAMVVVGRQEDDLIGVLAEFLGSFDNLKKEAVNLKDRFSLKKILFDKSFEEDMKKLRRIDGLCEYFDRGLGPAKTPLYIHPVETWTYFVSRNTKAYIIPISEQCLEGYESACRSVQTANREGDILISQECPRLESLVNEGLKTPKHPLYKALTWCHWTLEREVKIHGTTQKHDTNSWYEDYRW